MITKRKNSGSSVDKMTITVKNITDDGIKLAEVHKQPFVVAAVTAAAAFVLVLIILLIPMPTLLKICLCALFAIIACIAAVSALSQKHSHDRKRSCAESALRGNFTVIEDIVTDKMLFKERIGLCRGIDMPCIKTRTRKVPIDVVPTVFSHAEINDKIYLIRNSDTGEIIAAYLDKECVIDTDILERIIRYDIEDDDEPPADAQFRRKT